MAWQRRWLAPALAGLFAAGLGCMSGNPLAPGSGGGGAGPGTSGSSPMSNPGSGGGNPMTGGSSGSSGGSGSSGQQASSYPVVVSNTNSGGTCAFSYSLDGGPYVAGPSAPATFGTMNSYTIYVSKGPHTVTFSVSTCTCVLCPTTFTIDPSTVGGGGIALAGYAGNTFLANATPQ